MKKRIEGYIKELVRAQEECDHKSHYLASKPVDVDPKDLTAENCIDCAHRTGELTQMRALLETFK